MTPRKASHEREGYRVAELVRVFGSHRLDEIDAVQVREWATRRLDVDGVRPNTVNNSVITLKAMLTAAVPGHLERNPLARFPVFRADTFEPPLLQPDEEARILQVMRPVDRAIFLIGLDCLVRLGDILELRREQDHGTYLSILDSKNGSSYKVPISHRVRQALDALPRHADSPYYFPSKRRGRSGMTHTNGVQRLFRRSCERAGVRYGRYGGVTFHTATRHTGASRMIQAGVDIRTVQAIGGWRGLAVLTRYLHPSDAKSRRAVNLVDPTGAPAREVDRRRRSVSAAGSLIRVPPVAHVSGLRSP